MAGSSPHKGRVSTGCSVGWLPVACSFEAFSQAPRVPDALRCLGKMLAIWEERERKATSSGSGKDNPVPPMWLVCAGRPTTALEQFAFQLRSGWGPGVYRLLGAALPLGVVVVPELTRTRETLLLRLMGRGRTLREALEDLRELPADAWERPATARAIKVLRSAKAADADTAPDPEEEAIMSTASQVYEQIRNDGRQEGRQEGREEGREEGRLVGRRDVLREQIVERFGKMPSEAIAKLDCASYEQLRAWSKRVLTAATIDDVFSE